MPGSHGLNIDHFPAYHRPTPEEALIEERKAKFFWRLFLLALASILVGAVTFHVELKPSHVDVYFDFVFLSGLIA